MKQKCLQQGLAQSEHSMCRAFVIPVSLAHMQRGMALRLGTVTKRAEKSLLDLQAKQWPSLGTGIGRGESRAAGRLFHSPLFLRLKYFTIMHYFLKYKKTQLMIMLPPMREHLYLREKPSQTWNIWVKFLGNPRSQSSICNARPESLL